MRYYIIAALILFSSCNHVLKNENGVPFDSDKITGTYEISMLDLMPDDTSDYSGKGLVYGLASMFKMNVSFYENKKGAFSNNFSSKPEMFEYKIESDSILFIKSDSADFKKVGTIRKFTDNFDFIELHIDADSSKDMILNLKRTSK